VSLRVWLHDFDDFIGDFYRVFQVFFVFKVWRLKGGYGDSAVHVPAVWGFKGSDDDAKQ
jgi:hypothetical protein